MLKYFSLVVQLFAFILYQSAIIAMGHDINSEPLKIFHCFENLPDELQEKVLCDVIANTDSPYEAMKTVGILAYTCKKFNRSMHDPFFKKHIDQTIKHNLHKLRKIKIKTIKNELKKYFNIYDIAIEHDFLPWLKPQFNLDGNPNETAAILYKRWDDTYGLELKATWLHQAANYNAKKITQFMLDTFKNIEIDKFDSGGYTPLQIACINKSFEVAELLLKYGANPIPNNNHYDLTTNILNHLNNNFLTIKEKEKALRLLQAKQKINHSYLDRLDTIILKLELFKDYINRPSLFPLYFLAYMHCYWHSNWSMME